MSDAAPGSAPARKPFHQNLPLQLLGLLGWCLAWSLVQSALGGAPPALQTAILLGGGLLLLGAGLVGARRWTLQLLTSVPFAASQLLFLVASLLLGATVLQGLPMEAYEAAYGPLWWGGPPLFLVRHAHGADLFHCLWFLSLLLLVSASTLAVAWRRRPYPMHRVGFLLVHLAPAVILLGLLWGRLDGLRAFAMLRRGVPTSTFRRGAGDDPALWTEAVDLPGFTAKLERLQIDTYPPEFKLYAYLRPEGKGGSEGRPLPLAAAAGQAGRLPLAHLDYRIDQLLPNAVDAGQWVEDPAAPANPAIQLLLGLGDGQPILGYLLARDAAASRFTEPGGRFSILFRERFDPAEVASLKAHAPRRERLVLDLMGRSFEHDLTPGSVWEFPVFSLRVVRIHPDFPFKQGPDGPVDLARIPTPLRGPWAELLLRTRDGQEAPLFLSATAPAFSDEANADKLPPGTTLRYVREGDEPQRRFVLLTAEDRKVRLVENGRVLRADPLELHRPFVVQKGISVTPMAELPHATWVADFKPVPDPAEAGKFLNPALRLTVSDPATGVQESRWLAASSPAPTGFLGGRVALAFRPKETGPRDLRATLVLKDGIGRELARKQLSVNDPLAYGDYRFLQAGLDPGDPEASGILLVREPGLWLVHLGLALLVAGTLWMFYLKPVLKRRADGKEA